MEEKHMKFQEMPYERVDIDAACRQLQELKEAFRNASSGDEQFAVHKRFYELSSRIETLITIASIRNDIDMTDPFYEGERKYYDEKLPVLENSLIAYQSELLASPYRSRLEEIIGPVAFRNMELAAKTMDERIVPLMQEENQLTTEYNKLLATAKIEWEGETLNLSLMNPYLHHPDRRIRAEAWKKYSAFFAENREKLDDLYDRLVKNRTQQARTLGYENYLTLGYYRMRRNCYTRDDIAAFRRQVREDLVPFAEKLHERRRKRLGLSRLSYIDEGVYFLQGNPKPVGSPEQILEAGRKMYHELSPETGEFMDLMCSNDLFDVVGRKTKKTGGYMTFLPDYQYPFIFANFNGTDADAEVITHECGHAFQGWISAKDPIREHSDITMETAETHSMSMEFFTEPWMELFFGSRADDYRNLHLESSIAFIPYGTMVDEFQDLVYSNPNWTSAERNQAWRDLERQYKPHLDYEDNEYYEAGGFWQKQHHIYDCPLYYIDYCIAGVDALQYKAWMDQDFAGAWDSYLKLCRLSASDFFTGLLPQVGIRLPFEDGSVKSMIEKLAASIGIE